MEIEIPSSVEEIGDNAFEGCTGLTSIEIPSSVTRIGVAAFWGCSGLTSFEIPAGVTILGVDVIGACEKLTKISVSPDNPWFKAEGNCLLDKKTGKYLSIGCKDSVIPKGVTNIWDRAFRGCNSLISIEIPDSVTSIGNWAFDGCGGLTDIEIPSGVTKIGEGAFMDCSGLTSMEIPGSVTSIGRWAFEGCSGLREIKIWEKSPRKMKRMLAGSDLGGLENITLYVPSETGFFYRLNAFFSKFKEIVPKL